MEYRVLGPLEALGSEGPLPLGGAKQRALLALLILNANRVVSRERLIDELWGDDPPETAVTTVQVYVSRLRKLLPDETLADAAARLPARGRAGAASTSSASSGSSGEGRARLPRAIRSVPPTRSARRSRSGAGRLLTEFADEPFAQIEGGRLDDLRVAALEERIEADLALGRHAELIGELEALIASHPHRERLRAQLMLALYRSGRQSEALEVYRNVARDARRDRDRARRRACSSSRDRSSTTTRQIDAPPRLRRRPVAGARRAPRRSNASTSRSSSPRSRRRTSRTRTRSETAAVRPAPRRGCGRDRSGRRNGREGSRRRAARDVRAGRATTRRGRRRPRSRRSAG